jgi:chorismate mutase
VTDEIEAAVIATALPGATRHGPFTRDAKRTSAAMRRRRRPRRVAPGARGRRHAGGPARLLLGADRADRRSRAASDLDAVLALVDLGLAFMPAIAAAKRASGREIEDPMQEARVLEAARASAIRYGLDPDTVDRLFRAVIDAARTIQRQFVARPWNVEALDLERAGRPAIARISDLAIARAAELARDPEALARLDPEAVAERLDPQAAMPERLAIARGIVSLESVDDGRNGDRRVRR